MGFTPQLYNDSNTDLSNVVSYRQPNNTYRLGEDVISGKITNSLEAIKQSIYHIINTERYAYPIYGNDYGIELEQYIGKDMGTIMAGIQLTLEDALLQDDRITGVDVTNVYKSKIQHNACVVEFTVYTIYGDIQEEINVQ